MTPTLLEVQTWLAEVIQSPHGVKHVLSEQAAQGHTAALQWFPADLDLIERLDIYAEGYFLRLRHNLEISFPRTRGLLGETDFSRLAARYFEAYPSHTPWIQATGAALPEFAKTCTLWPEHPYLAELIHLEWAYTAILQRPSALPPPPTQAPQRLALHPSAQFLSYTWSVHRLWEASPSTPEAGTYRLCLHPWQDQPRLNGLSPLGERLCDALRAEVPLSELSQWGDEATALLVAWAHQGLVYAAEI